MRSGALLYPIYSRRPLCDLKSTLLHNHERVSRFGWPSLQKEMQRYSVRVQIEVFKLLNPILGNTWTNHAVLVAETTITEEYLIVAAQISSTNTKWEHLIWCPNSETLLFSSRPPIMNLDQFTFNFQLPSQYSSTLSSQPPLAASATATLAPGSGTASSSHAGAQARYRAKNQEIEKEKARLRMRKLRRRSGAPETSTSTDWKAFSSEELRAMKTFAAFREYVSEFMFWVSVDDNDPQAVAAYNQFIKNNTPNKSHDLSDDDLEFLFRHVTPGFVDVVVTANSPRNVHASKRVFLSLTHCLSLLRQMRGPKLDEHIDRDDELAKLELKRRRARERMARRRAAIKALPLQIQQELTERARASRTKYREQWVI
ncbi:hypothetical protein B0H13DRAFT_1899469 [Mycena leptocephala]|nr:hypothetical protein B0H13DRAFT_1899469 [Mycena leptocephala]